MRFGIVGSRKMLNRCMVFSEIDKFLDEFNIVEYGDPVIISGGADGVDSLAKDWAKKEGLDYIEFLPYFKVNLKARYDPVHYLARNAQIVDNSDHILAIITKESRGTIHTIKYAEDKNIPVKVVQL